MNEEHYMPCEGVDPETGKTTGNWHFCCVTTSKFGQPLIFPIGYCRSRKCVHKTPQEAADCFRLCEIESDARKYTGEDFLNNKGELIKGRNEFKQCVECGKPCKSYTHVGLQNLEYYLCDDHMTVEVLKKHVPQYTVNYKNNN